MSFRYATGQLMAKIENPIVSPFQFTVDGKQVLIIRSAQFVTNRVTFEIGVKCNKCGIIHVVDEEFFCSSKPEVCTKCGASLNYVKWVYKPKTIISNVLELKRSLSLMFVKYLVYINKVAPKLRDYMGQCCLKNYNEYATAYLHDHDIHNIYKIINRITSYDLVTYKNYIVFNIKLGVVTIPNESICKNLIADLVNISYNQTNTKKQPNFHKLAALTICQSCNLPRVKTKNNKCEFCGN